MCKLLNRIDKIRGRVPILIKIALNSSTESIKCDVIAYI